MDTQRLILAMIFFFSLFMLFEAWQRDTRGPSLPATAEKKAPDSPQAPPATTPAPTTKLEPPTTAAITAPQLPKQTSGEVVRVETDVFSIEIDSVGATITRAELKQHRGTVDTSKNFVLLEREPGRIYVAQSGLIGEGLPNHNTRFVASAKEYKLGEGQKRLEVRFEAQGEEGAKVAKVFVFERGNYTIGVRQEIQNTTATPLQPYAYYQVARDGNPPEGDSMMMPTYTGVAVYTDTEKFQKVAFDDIEKGKTSHTHTAADGWIGLVQHYFVTAWIPPENVSREFFTRRLGDNLYSAGVILPLSRIEPGASATQQVTLYAGPQDQDKLATIAPGLDLTVDYGWLTVIAAPLFWVLKTLHRWVGNWGVAIILLTVLIKLLFYPLSAASYKSMARMRVLAPKMQRLKEQYGDDRQRMQQAMMELYKTEKINPLGGCLPILVQIPVFISLYWVLLASFELRQAPFMLWIKDLAAPDPYFILPVLMGATMIIQTRLNPEPPDPVQAKIMKIMPIAFSVFFFFFPAGLVLYWLVNNILSIAQQWHITRSMEQHAAPAHGRR
ncbi:MAG: membrane protein insertase YidC [Betaproteobacteria bacterium]|nr:membrane protein insertase YidC [Betaproteobacteria bacterium]